jgi:folate-dependent tRNA-U54 methylase TrmFO/GidA
MNITHNIIPVSPLTKETLKKYKNDMEAQVRMNTLKDYVHKIYGDIIRSAMYGDINYTFALYNKPYLQDKKYIIELITELYLVFPDSLIQYTEKKLCGIEDSKIFEPCIVIDWS